MKQIILEYQGLIRSIIRKLTGSANEDIEQEIYIKTWRNLDNYQEQGKFRQWLSSVAANVCRDYYKSRQYRGQKLETGDDKTLQTIASPCDQEAAFEAKMRQKIILRAVDELPSPMKKVVVLVEFEGLSYEQTAQKLSIAVGTVKSRLFNAKKILSKKLSFLKGE